MANSLSSWTTFAPLTKIRSSPMNTNLQSLRDQAPMWQKYTLPYTTFSAMGAVATGTTTLFALASDEIITGVIVKHSTLFTGVGITAAKIKIGIASNTDKYMDEFDVKQAVSASAKTSNQVLEYEAASTNILVTCSLTGGNLSALTQGSVDIYFQRSELP